MATYKKLTETDEYKALVETTTMGGLEVSSYLGGTIIDLGDVDNSSVAETWAKRADVCSSTVRIIFYKAIFNSNTAILRNTYNGQTDTALQTLQLGSSVYVRSVTGISAATTAGTPDSTTATSWTTTATA